MTARDRVTRLAWLFFILTWLAAACNLTVALPTLVPTLTASATAADKPVATANSFASATANALPAISTIPSTPVVVVAPTATTETPTTTAAPTPRIPTATPTGTATPTLQPITGVLIISVDGLRPEGVHMAHTPNLDRLVARGAVTWNAQTVLPSATLPGHTSMLGGSSPEVHGVRWNNYQPERGYVPLPTLFSVARDAGMATAMYVGKAKLEHISVPGTVDTFVYVAGGDVRVAERAVDHIKQIHTDILFVHLPGVDGAGHAHGWLSDAQLEAVAQADAVIGALIDALDATGGQENILLIVTADHGGLGTSHGGSNPESMTIPWIIAGPRVRQGYVISGDVNVYDTAATAAWALGLSLPDLWEGTPIVEAFEP